MSREGFNEKRSSYIAAVAASVAVPASSVSIVKVVEIGTRRSTVGGFPRRALLAASVQVETAIKGVPASAVFSKTALDAQLVKQGLPESQALEVVAVTNSDPAEETGATVAPSGIFITVHPGVVAAASIGGGALLVLIPLVVLRRLAPSNRVAPSPK